MFNISVEIDLFEFVSVMATDYIYTITYSSTDECPIKN